MSSATRSKTFPTPGSAASRNSAAAPPGSSAPTRSSRPPVVVSDVDVDGPVADVVGRVRGDRVGEQQRVVEAVDRALRACGEHADDAPQHGPHERPAPDPDGRRLARPAHARRSPSVSACAASRSKVMRTSVSSEGPVPSSSDSASVAMSGSPRPEPRAVGAGQDPAPGVDDDDGQPAVVDERPHAELALPVGVGVDDDVRAGLGHRELDVRQRLVGDVERRRRGRRRRAGRRRRSPRAPEG